MGREISHLTSLGMNGNLSFEESFRQRLHLLQPSKEELAMFVEQNPLKLTKGIKSVIDSCHKAGVPTFLLSGGLTSIIQNVGKKLNIPDDNIMANKLIFDSNGMFSDYDALNLMAQSNGKALAIQTLIDKHHLQKVVMVGDGVTDLQAKPPASVFIGFGGNKVREKVKREADWFIYDFEEMEPLINLGKASDKHGLGVE
eukprot:Filipodium_phascolosomae@DN2490_c0_g1_i6.p1